LIKQATSIAHIFLSNI